MKHEGISDAGVVQLVEQKSETEIKPNQTDTCIIIKKVWIRCHFTWDLFYLILFYYFFNLKKSRRIRCYLKKKKQNGVVLC